MTPQRLCHAQHRAPRSQHLPSHLANCQFPLTAGAGECRLGNSGSAKIDSRALSVAREAQQQGPCGWRVAWSALLRHGNRPPWAPEQEDRILENPGPRFRGRTQDPVSVLREGQCQSRPCLQPRAPGSRGGMWEGMGVQGGLGGTSTKTLGSMWGWGAAWLQLAPRAFLSGS